MKCKLQPLDIPDGWEMKRNVFYDIDPNDNLPEDDKFDNIYCQEDMLWITNGDYNLDLGWYGSNELDKDTTGFMLVLFKGKDWNNCDLLELHRTKSKVIVIKKMEELLKAITKGFFDGKQGYEISDSQTSNRFIGEHQNYSMLNNTNELIK